MADSVVSARKLSLTFETNDGPVHALSDVDLVVKKGEFVSFIGPSGCGKTTFLRVIADLERPTSGEISVNGMTPDEARKARAYGYVFQAASLYPWRTIEKNVGLPLEIMGYDAADARERTVREHVVIGIVDEHIERRGIERDLFETIAIRPAEHEPRVHAANRHPMKA